MIRISEATLAGAVHQRGYRNYAILKMRGDLGYEEQQAQAVVGRRARKSAVYRKTFEQTLQQIDLALLVREMREDAGFTQTELAKRSVRRNR